ncbi:hypothetical protein QE152_g38382 [Popillia japonica]|uniref:MARVEL domain-containing protein n=1 Tax=Popillia japonica TaxID=7064 RepID=A0AAW1HYD1_POPJA
MKSAKELFNNINFVFKLVEWILCLILCVFVGDLNTSYYHLKARDLIVVASAGYFIITFTLFLIYIFDNTNILYELITIFVGAILFLVTGLLCIIHYSDGKDRGTTLVVAIFAIACGVVMLVDWLFLFKKRNE